MSGSGDWRRALRLADSYETDAPRVKNGKMFRKVENFQLLQVDGSLMPSDTTFHCFSNCTLLALITVQCARPSAVVTWRYGMVYGMVY